MTTVHAAQSIAGTFISAVASLATAAPPIKPRPIILAIQFHVVLLYWFQMRVRDAGSTTVFPQPGSEGSRADRHSIKKAMATPQSRIRLNKRSGNRNVRSSESSESSPAIRKRGPVMAQCSVRFLNQFAKQPAANAKRIAAADRNRTGRQ